MKRSLVMLLALGLAFPTSAAYSQPGSQGPATEVAPPRVGYVNGQVSFWRPGAPEWTPAALNTPLAPGDLLYTGPDGTVEVQIGARAFVRAADGTQLGLEDQEPDFVQFKVTMGHAAVDVRELPPGHTVELDTPNAAVTIEQTGYYRIDVDEGGSTLTVRRGGRATMTPAGGGALTVTSNQQVMVSGTASPRIQTAIAPELTPWDRWNYERTGYLLASDSARYVPPGVYGTRDLDLHGTWRVAEPYGPVWVPTAVPVGWVPYSTGRWIWDPIYGWTWLDEAPWGWAPYHHGRWVFVHGVWAWAPGPILVRPVYAPALVVFLGGPVVVHRPIFWAALGWGEPVIPWWGRGGFAGRPWWGGWGGPRVVNNVVVHNTTVVNVTNITVYRNVSVANAVVGVPAERFGRDAVARVRLPSAEARQLEPVRTPLAIRPAPASLAPAEGRAVRPPESVVKRPVVATRAPRDVSATPHAEGLMPKHAPTAPSSELSPASPSPAPAPRLVPPPPRGGAVEERGVQGPAQPPRVTTVPRPTPPAATPGAPAPSVRPAGPEVKPPPPGANSQKPEVKQSRPVPPPAQLGRGGPKREEPVPESRTGRAKESGPPPEPKSMTGGPPGMPSASPRPPARAESSKRPERQEGVGRAPHAERPERPEQRPESKQSRADARRSPGSQGPVPEFAGPHPRVGE